MKIKIFKLSESATIPTSGTDQSAGYDLYVDTDEEIMIKPHETLMLQTNIAMAIPEGHFGAIYARSGMSTKKYLRPATCVSVIDADYRGSIGVPMHNDSEYARMIKPHERVAQLVIHKCEKVNFEEVNSVEELGITERGNGGFGSTGKQ